MNLTEREREILQLSRQGLSDYKIARRIGTDPPSVTRSRKNAEKKLAKAITDLEWALRLGVDVSGFNFDLADWKTVQYTYFL